MFLRHNRGGCLWKTGEQSGLMLLPESDESDNHLFPESCVQDDLADNYAKSEAFGFEYRALTDTDDGQKWPKGLTEEDGKL